MQRFADGSFLISPYFSQGEMIKGVIFGSITGFSAHCAIKENDSIPDRLFSPMAETGRDPLPPIGSFGGQAWTGPYEEKS